MAIKRITAINVQAHKLTSIGFPEKGIIAITGDNSAGKSALLRPLRIALTNRLHIPGERKTLINDSENIESCKYIIEMYNGYAYTLNIDLEASKTWYALTKPDGSEIKRYLSDKINKELFRDLGFHYDYDRDMSLNIRFEEDPKLFVTTSPSINGDLIKTALTDYKAEIAKANINNVLKNAKETKELFEKKEIEYRTILSTLGKEVDIEEMEQRLDQLTKLYSLLKTLKEPKSISLKSPPNVNFGLLSLKVPKQKVTLKPPLNFEKILNFKLPKKINLSFAEIKMINDSLEQGKCPICAKEISYA